MASSRRPSFSLDPLWPHYASAGIIAVTFVLGVLRFLLLDWSDPIHCNALLTSGQWLDSKFKNWQPDGCMMHQYSTKDVSTCFKSSRVVFVGDSVTRQLFFALMHLVDKDLPSGPPSIGTDDEIQKHRDYSYSSSAIHSEVQVEFSFVWDPFLNTSRTQDILHAREPGATPELLVLGTGLWFLRNAEAVGGMHAWEATVGRTFDAIKTATPPLAHTVVFLPVEQVVPSLLTPDRSATMHPSDIDAMNSELSHLISPPPTAIFGSDGFMSAAQPAGAALPIALPLAFNKMLDPSQTEDGLHFSQSILSTQANILLNLRCNEEFPKKYPVDMTCCRSYPTPPLVQIFVLAFFLFWGPVARIGRPYIQKNKYLTMIFPSEEYAMSMSIFGLAIGLTFFADRTSIWLKEQKAYGPWSFAFLSLLALAIGLGTMKSADKDLGFLNRDQTDEWKGWMQLAILVYHYLGASKISGIYNPIRALVAAYLFQTGYGHTMFFITKADFGFLRVAQVMVRLNLLTIALAYAMNTDYLTYYFAPLVSWWFVIIYVTLYVGKAYNTSTAFVLGKIALSAALVTWFMNTEWLLKNVFAFLYLVFKIKWSAQEWAFRVNLDAFIVYFGMLAALAFIKFREFRLNDHRYWPLAYRSSLVGGAIVMIWYFGFELSMPDKFAYNKYHPFVAVLPVAAFIILRNANVKLRGATSRAFVFIGRCSLETFILQYHIWLAADTKGILLVIPGTTWRPLNLVLSTIMFIYISHKVAAATGDLTTWICGKKPQLPTTATTSAPRPPPQPTVEEIPLASQVDGPQARDQENGAANGERWVDRLASGAGSTKGPGFRLFMGSAPTWEFGLPGKIAAALAVLWALNVLWP